MDKVQGRLSDFFSDTRNRIIVAGTCVCVAVVIGVIVVAVVIQPTSASPTAGALVSVISGMYETQKVQPVCPDCNNGTCYSFPRPNTAYCGCPLMQFGARCQLTIDQIVNINSCKTSKCTCAIGYTGDNCQNMVNYCTNIGQCRNKGLCIAVPGDYVCRCLMQYTGPHCETYIYAIAGNSGSNGGYSIFNDMSMFESYGRISAMKVCIGWYIDSIQIRYGGTWSAVHGGSGGDDCRTAIFSANEQMNSVTVFQSRYNCALTFISNVRTWQFNWCKGTQAKIIAFNQIGGLLYVQGHFGWYLDYVEFYHYSYNY